MKKCRKRAEANRRTEALESAIQSDVLDALESAESLEEFRSQLNISMDEIISEAQKVR
jgi:hypothetical protein